MNVLLQWLVRQAILFYLACLIGVIGYVVNALTARRRLQAAQFSLEKRVIRRKMRRAWVMAGLFLLLGLFIFLIERFVLPELPAVETPTPPLEAGLTPRPTSTPTPSPTPTPTLAPLMSPETETAPAENTPNAEGVPTPSPAPTSTPLPTAEPPLCPSPNVQLIAPIAGSQLSGVVEIRGTATLNAFAYYKFEVQFPGSDTPNFISQFNSPVENGILGYWDVSDALRYPPGGPYRFRLVAVDIYGNATSCVIPVYIVEQ
ncbi:MAG: hypothetical protein ACP5HM_04875 [Anaerolineae bacterium]